MRRYYNAEATPRRDILSLFSDVDHSVFSRLPISISAPRRIVIQDAEDPNLAATAQQSQRRLRLGKANPQELEKALKFRAVEEEEEQEGIPEHVDVMLVVRLPNGERVLKFFEATARLESVYTWIFEEMAEHRDLNVHQFELRCDFPDRQLSATSISLVDAGLYPRALLSVRPS